MSYKGTIGPGKIIVFASHNPRLTKKGETYSKLQVIFTRMKWTHTALGFFRFDGKLDQTLFESKELQSVSLWKPGVPSEYVIYQIKWYTQEEIETALWKTFIEYNGEPYGFLQILYFVRRYIWETKWIKKYFGWLPRLFGKPDDVRHWNNWFVGGTICSELFYNLMHNLNEIRYNPKLREMLRKWNKNNFHSGDSYTFVTGLPEIFEFEYHKPGGVIE